MYRTRNNGNNINQNQNNNFETHLETWTYEPFQGVTTIVVGNPNHPRGGNRPVFNVSEPFNGVVTVQMNESFAGLLNKFISEIDGNIEKEVNAFSKALNTAHRICGEERRSYKRQRDNNRPNNDFGSFDDNYQPDDQISHSLIG